MMRKKSKFNVALAIGVLTAASGCISPWTPIRSAASSVSVVQNASSVSPAENLAISEPTELLEPNADDDAPQTTEEAMAAVMDELQQIGEVDHAAQQKLMADLREAKPEHWSRIVQQFQSALAFREQLVTKESQSQEGETQDSVYALQENNAPKDHASKKHAPKERASVPSMAASSEQTDLGANDPMPPMQNTPKPTALAMVNLAASQPQAVEQTSHATLLAPTGASDEHLQAAITSMEQSTQEPPSSVEDVQQHMRLRLLRLLAGQESAAVSPIPGASSTQQDYWSKQLFALSTYLDNQQQPDIKRRAAGSLIHLDSARASLAELATLQVRNLTFVDSVDGFGVYQQHEETKFRPGEQVTLYTEVENFRSQSTKEGFHTRLSTSYEVLDKHGTRVDGAQFPDVEDRCKNQRRDFHMQYGVALPTQIYAGQYQLKLTITDQMSHKIGQTSVPFEIIE